MERKELRCCEGYRVSPWCLSSNALGEDSSDRVVTGGARTGHNKVTPYPLPGSLNDEAVAVTLDESTLPCRIAVTEKKGGLRHYCLADAHVWVAGLHSVLASGGAAGSGT